MMKSVTPSAFISPVATSLPAASPSSSAISTASMSSRLVLLVGAP